MSIYLNDDRIVHPNTLDDHNHQIVFRSYLKSLRSSSYIDFYLIQINQFNLFLTIGLRTRRDLSSTSFTASAIGEKILLSHKVTPKANWLAFSDDSLTSSATE